MATKQRPQKQDIDGLIIDASPVPDWNAIESEYRTGQLSIRMIARIHGVSHEAVRKRAKANGWIRDLADQVNAQIQGICLTPAVDMPVDTDNARDAVNYATMRAVQVVRQHRATLLRLHSLAERMIGHMEEALDGNLAAVSVPVKRPDGGTDRFALPFLGPNESLCDALVKVSQTVAKLLPLERRAFSLDVEVDPTKLTTDQLRAMVKRELTLVSGELESFD